MKMAKRIEIIQAETGYVITVLAPDPAQIAQQLDQLKELRDTLGQIEIPEMREFAEMMSGLLNIVETGKDSMFGEAQERVVIASDGRELLAALAKIIAIWEPEEERRDLD